MEFSKAASTFPFADRVNATPEPTVVGKHANTNKPSTTFSLNHPDSIKTGAAAAMTIVGKTKMNACVNALSDTSLAASFNALTGNPTPAMKNKAAMAYFSNPPDPHDPPAAPPNDSTTSRNSGDALAHAAAPTPAKKKFSRNHAFTARTPSSLPRASEVSSSPSGSSSLDLERASTRLRCRPSRGVDTERPRRIAAADTRRRLASGVARALHRRARALVDALALDVVASARAVIAAVCRARRRR
jgi:hypothetical protein